MDRPTAPVASGFLRSHFGIMKSGGEGPELLKGGCGGALSVVGIGLVLLWPQEVHRVPRPSATPRGCPTGVGAGGARGLARVGTEFLGGGRSVGVVGLSVRAARAGGGG